MKLWQIKNVLSDELENFNDYQQDMAEHQILQALEKSSKMMLVTVKGYLRLTFPSDNSAIVEKLSIIDAYRKFGGNAINEVIDYGSFTVGIRR